MSRWITYDHETGEGFCADCGQTFTPGEHTGHSGHFTGAWFCHDCGALCDGDGDDYSGECDTCGQSYDVSSRDGRCGDCGNCAEHCDHAAVSA